LKDFKLSSYPIKVNSGFPTYKLTIKGAPPASMTIAAYGYMAELAKQAVSRLAYEHEIFAELVVPTQLSPYEIDPILTSTNQTGSLLVVEEGTLTLGWGSEVIARIAEAAGIQHRNLKRLAAKEVPVASSGPLEAQILPGVEQIIQSAFRMVQ
jgi:pyruvate/2-oxoglutarate/acetoin dehydrogenase E1 component